MNDIDDAAATAASEAITAEGGRCVAHAMVTVDSGFSRFIQL